MDPAARHHVALSEAQPQGNNPVDLQSDLPSDLPPPDTVRWVARRKAQVVKAIRDGRISTQRACRLYSLTEEELQAWEDAFEAHGLAGLSTTKLQRFRR